MKGFPSNKILLKSLGWALVLVIHIPGISQPCHECKSSNELAAKPPPPSTIRSDDFIATRKIIKL